MYRANKPRRDRMRTPDFWVCAISERVCSAARVCYKGQGFKALQVLSRSTMQHQPAAPLPSPFGAVGESGALLAEPVFGDQGAALPKLVPLLCVALHDISHTMPAEGNHIAELFAPACLHTALLCHQKTLSRAWGSVLLYGLC